MSYPLVRECIAPGVYFSAITDKKFKHNRMSVNLIAKLDRQKVTGRAVVPFILRQGSKNCPDFTQLNKRLCDLYGASLLFIVASLALGVWLSTLASTQFQAMQMAFFTFLPQILLSGFMFPFAGMPRAAQWIAEFMPLTHYLRLSRGIMLRGAGVEELWREILILGVFCIVLLGLAVMRIHKRLD